MKWLCLIIFCFFHLSLYCVEYHLVPVEDLLDNEEQVYREFVHLKEFPELNHESFLSAGANVHEVSMELQMVHIEAGTVADFENAKDKRYGIQAVQLQMILIKSWAKLERKNVLESLRKTVDMREIQFYNDIITETDKLQQYDTSEYTAASQGK
jgi:hypothetical protein